MLKRILFATCVILGFAGSAAAQGDQAKISGIVKDQSGLGIPGVTVVVTNMKTGLLREVVSVEDGHYTVTNLAASTYSVKAALSGFSPADMSNIQLLPGQALTLNVDLKPAGVSETVTVSAMTATLDLSSARMGTNVVEREVKDLPINGRQLSQLYLQAPGSVNAGTGTFGDIRFSGRAVQQNVVKYDGVEGTAIIDASPGNLNGQVPSPFRLQASLENVQEFRVESSNFPAEYGTGTGGQISVVSKSGTNAVRGSAFEYYRNDRFDSPNYFDLSGKAPLTQHQYGGSIGMPVVRNKTFLFASYEGYRLDAGVNFVEAAPSATAWARAVPAILALRPAMTSPQAVLLTGKSTNADFDIYQLQSLQTVRENAFSARVDHRINSQWSGFARIFADKGTNLQPEGISGRVLDIKARPSNAVVSLQGILSGSVLNEFRIGYNRADSDVVGIASTAPGVDLSAAVINLTGSVANTGISGQGSSSGVVVAGGLSRLNSATNGRSAPYRPYSLSFMDTLTVTRGEHTVKMGAEYRMIRIGHDQQGGTTYTFGNIAGFLANTPTTISYLGDLSEPSVFNGGATGMRHFEQEYYIGYAQDEWRATPSLTLNLGVRYEYYTPLRERQNLAVLFNIDTGTLKDPSTDFYKSPKNNFLPRVSVAWSPNQGKTSFRGGFGISVGPGQTEDLMQPIESDRISTSLTSGTFPANPATLRANFINNPNNRQYQPRAYANEYSVPERVYQYTGSVQRELPGGFVATVAYVGSQGRNLFLRTIANRIKEVRTNANPASAAVIIREYDIINADGSISRPYAEIDVKTSGGKDSYNALQTQLVRRIGTGLTLNGTYTFSKSYGHTGGSNDSLTAANGANPKNLAEFDYDLGYNQFDIRHAYNVSALYSLPFGAGRRIGGDWSGVKQALLGGWDVGAIVNGRSGLPIDVRITRPDVVYRDATGNIFGTPAVGRVAIINTPGGGASRNVRRPDLVPGVNPYLKNGTQWLNPAAFATPAPGTYGNLQRGALRGPGSVQLDLLIDKRFNFGTTRNFELRLEVFNLFDKAIFNNPVASLPNVLGTASNQLQPGQPFTPALAGTFGSITSTVGRTVGLGTSRQVQFAVRVNF